MQLFGLSSFALLGTTSNRLRSGSSFFCSSLANTQPWLKKLPVLLLL